MAADGMLSFHALAPAALGGLRPEGVRLGGQDAPLLLLATEPADHQRRFWQLRLRDITDAQPPEPLLVHQLPANLPWDARVDATGWQLLTIRPGGALAPLMWLPAGARTPQPVEPRGPRSLFGMPRFVAAPAAGDIVALNLARDSAITLLRRHTPGAEPRRQELLPPRPGTLQQAQLLPWRDGHLLFVQTFVPNAGYRLEGSVTAREARYAGSVAVHALDARGRRAGPAWAPLGEQPVFDFGIAVAGDQVGVLAVTAQGWLLAGGRPDLQGRGFGLLAQGAGAAALSSPCLQALPGRWRLAMIQDAGGTDPRVLLAEWPWQGTGRQSF